jgi:iron complex outermembrane receptor protein
MFTFLKSRPTTAPAALLFSLLVLPAVLRAQGTIAGTIASARDNSPLADVTMFVAGLRRGAVTDADGHYRIQAVPAGQHRVVAQRVGFAPDTVSATVTESGVVTIDVKLKEAAVVVAPMVVAATRELQDRNDGSMTIDALAGQEVRVTRAGHPAEIMNKLAGVHMSQLSGEGHSMAIRMPISTNPWYLYLEDGVPTRPTGFFNHNALYEVNMPQSAGVEVIKGPGTALYGSDAIGGIVNSLTRAAPKNASLEAGLEGGAYGYRRLLTSGGNTWGRNGIRADLNVTHSDNWKKEAAFDRMSGTLRWDFDGGSSGWTAKTVLTGSRIDQQDVPAVSERIFDTAMTVNLAPIAYRKVRALRFSSAIEKQSGATLWSFTPFGRINDMGLLPSWQLSYDPQTWETKNNSLGFLARWRRDVTPLNGQIIVGADADYSPGSFFAQRAVLTRSGPYNAYTAYTSGDIHYDYDVTYSQMSPYVQTQWNPVARLRIDAGVRADFSSFDYDTHLAPLDTGAHRRPASTKVSYSHFSPKVGASYDVAREFNVFASYRNGFRTPSQGQLFQQNSARNSVGLIPVKVNSYEAGMRGQLGQRFVYQVSAYDMTMTDDILTFVTTANTREATNAGSSRHRGIEMSAGAAVTSDIRLDLAYSNATHKYVDWTPSASTTAPVTYSGKYMEMAPRDLSNVSFTWSPRALNSGRIVLEWAHLGKYAEDPANTKFYSGYELFNINANYNVNNRAEVFGRVINAANRRFAELVTYDAFQKDQYTPGTPRSVFLGLKYTY